jgi:NitT/TauT family transport system substrate-binding protein
MSTPFVVWGAKDLNTSAQLVLAKRLGFFKNHGLDVQCKLFPSEQRLTEALLFGESKPLAWAQTVPGILRLYTQGADVRIIAPLADISASYQVVLREDAGIALPGDLEERSIGMVKGSLIEVAFRNMAKDFGVDLEKVNFIDVPPTKQLELFVDGEIDGIACWEPWTSQAQYMGGRPYFSGLYSMIPGHDGKVNWLTGQSMLVTSAAILDGFPEILVTLLKAVKQATDYLNDTVNKAAVVLGDLLGVENTELTVLLQKNLYTMKMDELFQVGLASIRNVFPSLLQAPADEGTMMRSVNDWPVQAMYTPDLLRVVDPLLIALKASPDMASLESETSSDAGGTLDIVVEDGIYYPAGTRIQAMGGTPSRYIIVDDTQVVIDLFSDVVEMIEGTVVGTASTGAEALVLYVDQLPDIVVMDISMPDMSGLEAIERILGMNPAANVIVISGNNYEEVRQKVFELGGKLFISKPFHVDQIVKVLTKLMD